MSPNARTPVEVEPIARVLPMLSVPHLDREFDYLVSAEQSDDAQPGVRVRVRFHGRLVDGFVLERRDDTDHAGKLGWLDRVVSAEPVLTPDVRRLVEAVAARYAGTRADVLRLAVPPRHARVESEAAPAAPHAAGPEPVDPAGWGGLRPAAASSWPRWASRGPPGRVWQALPGEPWADRFAEAAAQTVVAPAARCWRSCPTSATSTRCARAAIGCDRREQGGGAVGGPRARPQRYRRWLAALRGSARLVIGTRSAVFAPVADLGLVMVWDDGDDSLAEPRAPYPHAREVAMLRAHQLRCAALIGGYARTAEAHALVRSGWAHDLVAARPVVRARTPRVVALDDSGYADERDPAARTARLPSIALRAARSALAGRSAGAGPGAAARLRALAGLRALPHDRPVPALHGPAVVAGPRGAGGAVCRWCGRGDPRCGARAAGPTRCAPWSSAPAAPPRSSAGRFPAPR